MSDASSAPQRGGEGRREQEKAGSMKDGGGGATLDFSHPQLVSGAASLAARRQNASEQAAMSISAVHG